MVRGFTLAAVAALAAGGVLAEPLPIDPSDADQVTRGEALYARSCASCHGADLEGQEDWRSPGPNGVYPASPHDRTGHTWHHPDDLLFRYVKFGGAEVLKDVAGAKSGMPGFGGDLTDREIMDVLAFIKSRWPKRAQDYQRRVSGGGGE